MQCFSQKLASRRGTASSRVGGSQRYLEKGVHQRVGPADPNSYRHVHDTYTPNIPTHIMDLARGTHSSVRVLVSACLVPSEYTHTTSCLLILMIGSSVVFVLSTVVCYIGTLACLGYVCTHDYLPVSVNKITPPGEEDPIPQISKLK